ncbi:MAG: nitroreductase/quinone reductase family protein [Pseudomonadales bacterium]|nr:nitroreductase family deazaflavin-dependent oxidoreductase [Pseudomonadales bacterium]
MKLLKWLGGILAVYVVFVVVFEAGYLGTMQPSFEEGGIPMLVLTTTDDSGKPLDRMLASFETDGRLYVSAHHWTRGWYERALKNPQVRVNIGGVAGDYTAVHVGGEEFERVAATHPLPLVVRFLMGFPPLRDILRLDPAATMR